MEKYLYLTKREWQAPWVNGGEIPINLASAYRSADRRTIFTPDENTIHDSPVDLTNLPGICIRESIGISMTNVVVNGKRLPSIVNASIFTDDGLILSFCNNESAEIARRLGKVCGVRIRNIESLFRLISEQLGLKGEMGSCKYTNDHQRNHFLKSAEDAWQDEFRMFWRGDKPRMVRLPSGIAEPLALDI